MLAGRELDSFFFTKSWCFAGHQRGWHLRGLTLGTPSLWCSLRLQSSLKDIGVLPIKPCQKGAQAVCPAARVLRDDWCPSPLAWPHLFPEGLQKDTPIVAPWVWDWGIHISAVKEETCIFPSQSQSKCSNCCCCFMSMCCFSPYSGKGAGAWNLIRKRHLTQHSWAVLSSAFPKVVPCWPARIWFFVSKSSGLHGEAGERDTQWNAAVLSITTPKPFYEASYSRRGPADWNDCL